MHQGSEEGTPDVLDKNQTLNPKQVRLLKTIIPWIGANLAPDWAAIGLGFRLVRSLLDFSIREVRHKQ